MNFVVRGNDRTGGTGTDIRRQDTTPDGGDAGWTQNDVSKIMILELRIWAAEFEGFCIETNGCVEKVKPRTVGAIKEALLRIKIVVRTSVVLVDVVALNQDSLDGSRESRTQPLNNALWIVFCG